MTSDDTVETEETTVADTQDEQEPEAVDLGGAAQGALDSDDDEMPVQQALGPAHKIQFNGMGMKGLENVPAMDEERTFLVRARCSSLTQRRMKTTHDIQHVASMEVLEVKDYDEG